MPVAPVIAPRLACPFSPLLPPPSSFGSSLFLDSLAHSKDIEPYGGNSAPVSQLLACRTKPDSRYRAAERLARACISYSVRVMMEFNTQKSTLLPPLPHLFCRLVLVRDKLCRPDSTTSGPLQPRGRDARWRAYIYDDECSSPVPPNQTHSFTPQHITTLPLTVLIT